MAAERLAPDLRRAIRLRGVHEQVLGKRRRGLRAVGGHRAAEQDPLPPRRLVLLRTPSPCPALDLDVGDHLSRAQGPQHEGEVGHPIHAVFLDGRSHRAGVGYVALDTVTRSRASSIRPRST